MEQTDNPILRRTLSSDLIPELNWWINSAYLDYRAARTLILNGELLQAAIFANTAVEKYAKATLLVKGDRVHGHLKKGMFRGIKNFCEDHFDSLNMEFMDLLQKSYFTRYFEDIPNGFHIEIIQNKFLVELDNTAYQFNQRFHFKVEGKVIKTMYVEDFEDRNPALLYKNFILTRKEKRSEFIAQIQHYLDLKKDENGDIVLYTARIGGVPDDSRFTPLGIDHLDGKTPLEIFKEQKTTNKK